VAYTIRREPREEAPLGRQLAVADGAPYGKVSNARRPDRVTKQRRDRLGHTAREGDANRGRYGEPQCIEAEQLRQPRRRTPWRRADRSQGVPRCGGTAQIIFDDLAADKSIPSGNLDQVVLPTLALKVRLYRQPYN
jgi:hypothetical protein